MKTAKLFRSPLRRAKSRRDGTLLTVCFSLRTFNLRAILLPALMFFFCASLHAQVTMGGLEDPKSGAILDLNSTVKGGLLLSNVELLNLYTIPYTGTTPFPGVTSENHESVKGDFAGAIVYHAGENGYPAGVYLWNGTNWSPAGENCRTLTADDLTLTGLPFAKVNTPVNFSVSSKLSDRCSEGETYTWSASPGTVTFTPSSGAATSAVFLATGEYTLTVTAQNPYMPTSITKTLQVTVNTDGSLPFTMQDGAYGIVGQTCLDAKVQKQPATQSDAAYNARVDAFANQADYTKTYRFIHNNAYGNLNLILLDPAGLVESVTSPAPDGAAPVTEEDKEETFTLTFKSNIKTRVPSNGDSLTVKLIATYMNSIGSPRVAYLEIRVEDGTCICPAKKDADTWLNYMCHNLGGLDIISPSQLITREHHGDWYRFGAKSFSMENTQANDTRINSWDNATYQSDNNNWTDDPCPAGWRLPDYAELAAVINKDVSGNNIAEINLLTNVPATWLSASNQTFSNLKKSGDYLYLPSVGFRLFTTVALGNRGVYGYYWSSTGSASGGRNLFFSSENLRVETSNRGYGYSIRCVQAE